MSGFDIDVATLEDAVRSFIQTFKRPQHWTQVVTRSGVSLDRPSAIILQTLLANKPRKLRVQDLAQQLGIEPPSITRKTQQLEEAGCLKRQVDANDRRATTLEVTAYGKRAADKLWTAHRQIMSDALRSWPASERHTFVKLFQKFADDMSMISTKQPIKK